MLIDIFTVNLFRAYLFSFNCTDGKYSGPPRLFRHSSMQKIRHCCQNLNLLPYLLYSFDNSKSHPLARKIHVLLSHFFHDLVVGIFVACSTLRESTLRFIYVEKSSTPEAIVSAESSDLAKPTAKFNEIEKPKRKHHSYYLVAAVYLAPLLLACQVITLCSLTIFGKYTPGFIFLIAALLFLGAIAMKILSHQSLTLRARCKTKKVQ